MAVADQLLVIRHEIEDTDYLDSLKSIVIDRLGFLNRYFVSYRQSDHNRCTISTANTRTQYTIISYGTRKLGRSADSVEKSRDLAFKDALTAIRNR